ERGRARGAHRRAAENVRRQGGGRLAGPADRPRRGLRAAGAQRVGKDDHHPHALRADAAQLGHGHHRGARRGARAGKGAAVHRLHVPEVRPVRRHDGGREPPLLCLGLRTRGPRARAAHGPAAGRAGAGAARPADDGNAQRRVEAARGPGLRHGPSPAHAVPGRAHGGGGPGRAAPVLADHPPARRGGHHHPRHHALHGRGGAVPPHRLPVAQPADRARHAGGNRRAVRPAQPRGRLHRAAAPRRGGAGM
ncbi:MAG: Efflux ABC transporter, ATP-binding protein, partial [uncultured Gemmatimonadetes bacterium]